MEGDIEKRRESGRPKGEEWTEVSGGEERGGGAEKMWKGEAGRESQVGR